MSEAKKEPRKPLKGFGMTFDFELGTTRNWYVGDDGVKRWVDNNEPVEK